MTGPVEVPESDEFEFHLHVCPTHDGEWEHDDPECRVGEEVEGNYLMQPLLQFENREPLARHSDPQTSHLAAEKITETGQRMTDKLRVYLALKQFGGQMTSAELAKYSGMERHTVARRLPDLEADGHVRRAGEIRCGVAGTQAIAWEAIQK